MGTPRSFLEHIPTKLATHIPNAWHELTEDNVGRKASWVKKRLCNEVVNAMTPDLLKERDPDDEVIGWLRQMEQMINSGSPVATMNMAGFGSQQ